MDPLRFDGPAPAAMQRLLAVLAPWPRTRIVYQDRNYLHVEFTTTWLRFVDDVQFLIDADRQVIHVRSASRVGYYDLGLNRRRIEAIRQAFPCSHLAPQDDSS